MKRFDARDVQRVNFNQLVRDFIGGWCADRDGDLASGYESEVVVQHVIV